MRKEGMRGGNGGGTEREEGGKREGGVDVCVVRGAWCVVSKTNT